MSRKWRTPETTAAARWPDGPSSSPAARDGQVRVFLNTCPHRGALICRRDEGNAEVLQCFYHAWTFNTHGELIGVPGEDAYGPYFDRGDLGLKQPPRVESYRGFIFVCFNPYVEDLVTYLAGAKGVP